MRGLAPRTARHAWSCAVLLAALASAGAARADDCAREDAALARDAAELPKVELANTTDWQNTCITLEVNMDFAARLARHAAQCPAAPQSASAAQWAEQGAKDTAEFRRRKCRHTF